MAIERPTPISSGQSSGHVDIVRLLVDEFGIAPTIARAQVSMGTISVDGRMWNGDKFSIPFDYLNGKILIVIGPDRKFRLHYKG